MRGGEDSRDMGGDGGCGPQYDRHYFDAGGRDAAIADLHAVVADLRTGRDRLQSDLAAVKRGAEALRDELTARRLEVAALRQEGLAKDTAISDLRARQESLAADVAVLHRSAEDKDRLIAGLNYHLLALQRTIGWKVLERLRRMRDRLLPPDSRRRDLYWRIRRPHCRPRCPGRFRTAGPNLPSPPPQ